ncbi:MAG: hypothetical protein ABI811_19280 [Acidobacteriota bacterium]
MKMDAQIRLATGSDGAAIPGISRPFVTSAPTSFEMQPPDGEERGRRVEKTLPALPWLVCEEQGRVLGYIYASLHRERFARARMFGMCRVVRMPSVAVYRVRRAR